MYPAGKCCCTVAAVSTDLNTVRLSPQRQRICESLVMLPKAGEGAADMGVNMPKKPFVAEVKVDRGVFRAAMNGEGKPPSWRLFGRFFVQSGFIRVNRPFEPTSSDRVTR